MKKKILYNISASLTLEIVSVICAFVLPRMIISGFGSEYNGIVSSVTQFLSVVTLLRGGIGGVTRAALYRPLVENDTYKISAIIKATEAFMRKIVYIFAVFLILFAASYPVLVSKEFDWLYTFTLVLILGISTISQYYFGITYQFLLSADQKSYIYNILQTIATILNTVFSVVLIKMGVEFRLMKLISALVFATIPIALYWYVHRNYAILKTVPKDNTAIKQRWDAFIHQLAAFLHTNTDVMLLTMFSTLYDVSVYSVYNMIVYGVRKFVTVFTSGIESLIGKLIAAKSKQLESFVDMYEWVINVISTVVFGCTAVLIVPFAKVYTLDITDADYIQPALGYLLVLGSFFASIRLPYQSMVESAGHFKQTRNGAIIEALINLGLSLALIVPFKAVGVAIGTVVAMVFRTIQYAFYSSKNILKRSCLFFIKRGIVTTANILILAIPYQLCGIDVFLLNHSVSYFSWLLEALAVFAVLLVITLIVNIVAYRNTFVNIVHFLKKREMQESS